MIFIKVFFKIYQIKVFQRVYVKDLDYDIFNILLFEFRFLGIYLVKIIKDVIDNLKRIRYLWRVVQDIKQGYRNVKKKTDIEI